MGTTKSERNAIYDKVFQLLIDCHITMLPVSLNRILDFLEVSMIPLSRIIRGSRLSKEEILKVWGNNDGHLMANLDHGKEKLQIAYNDLDIPKGRIRFTISEEIAHIILEHYKDNMYRISNPTKWCDETYQQHEIQARLAAGLILCPPPVFDLIPSYLNIKAISGLCNITTECARMRLSMLLQHGYEIQSRNLYGILCNQFREFVLSKRCVVCGHGFISHDKVNGLCDNCDTTKTMLLVH